MKVDANEPAPNKIAGVKYASAKVAGVEDGVSKIYAGEALALGNDAQEEMVLIVSVLFINIAVLVN
jgi:hypothetical protein